MHSRTPMNEGVNNFVVAKYQAVFSACKGYFTLAIMLSILKKLSQFVKAYLKTDQLPHSSPRRLIILGTKF